MLPSATGQGQFINILGGEAGGQGIWGKPAAARAASFHSGEKGGEGRGRTQQGNREQGENQGETLGENSPQGTAAGIRGGTTLLLDQSSAL